MTEPTSIEPAPTHAQTGIEDQLWPIVCATAVLVGVLVTVIFVNSDFDDDRLLFNGYTQLLGVAALGAGIIFLGSLIKGRARRTAEIAILFSLALHALVGLGAGYVFDLPISVTGQRSPTRDAVAEDDDEPPPADYHWGQNDDDGTPEQAFEKPVATRLRDQMPPASQVQPRNLERPVPVAEMPRAAKVDVSPLGVGAAAEPSKPLDVRRPDAAKIDDLPPAQALAMARQKTDPLAVPDAPGPAPESMPEASKEQSHSIEARGVQVEKAEKYYWATVATKRADPNNLPIPAPRGRPPRHSEPSSAPLPSPAIVAKLPSQSPPRTSFADAGTAAADQISQQGGTPERSDRGSANMPSAVAPDAELPPTLPAAAGGSPGSRLELASNVPVERSESSHAPLGPSIASAGNQDFARGSSLLPARRGALDGAGRAEPSAEGASNAEQGEIRSGSPDSNSGHGLPLWSGPARRAVASQTDGGGLGLSADQSARLPRTQAETGAMLPAAARIADDVNLAGDGGMAARPGGMASALDVNRNLAVERVAGDGTPGNFHGSGQTGDGPLSDSFGSAGKGQLPGLGPIGPRRIAGGADAGDDNGAGGIPRARGAEFDPRATIDSTGPIGGAANVSRGPLPGTGPQGYSSGIAEPNLALGGAARLGGPSQRIGTRSSGTLEPTEIASTVGIAAPHAGLGGRNQGDGQLDQILSGQGDGTNGTGRGHGQFVVNSLVHEPLDAFRHGPVHGGPALGDSGEGQLTEPAIENGLAFFAHSQFADGHWSLHETPPGIPRDPSSGKELEADTAATGLALLSYMAAGYTHQDEKYRETVRRGIAWLIKHQSADGDLSYRGSDATHFYSHGIASMALCEAYGMTQDRDLREPAQKAIDFIARAQDPSRGGWRYNPQDGSDTSVTGWQLMALKSAQMAGLNVPDETVQKVGHWLDLAQVTRGRYVYNPWNLDTDLERKGREPSPTMTAQAMVMRMYLGQDHDQAVLQQGADYVEEHLPQVGIVPGAAPDCYYWYYATQAMYHMQGNYWKAWDARVTPLLRAGQIEKGPLKGSWSATDPVPDQWGQHAGRHYVTAMHVLTLEFRYWHLPLFRELRRD